MMWPFGPSSCSDVPKTRTIFVNSEQQPPAKLRTNKIRTCKYNAFTFLPYFLWEQFRRLSNVFFLFIVILQQLPNVSPTGRYTTVVPLLIILSVPAFQAILEDMKRRRMDSQVNHSLVDVLKNGTWATTLWKDVRVGDIVRMPNGQPFPADLVLLASSEPHGTAHIETSSLDGETNLKLRQAHPSTAHLTTIEALTNFSAQIECESPSRHLNEFHGKLMLPQGETHPLVLNQLLLRGAILKNTRWIFGVVTYSGHDAKLLMNSKTAPFKRSNIDSLINRCIIIFFITLIIVALMCAAGTEIYDTYLLPEAFYLKSMSSKNFAYDFLTFFILNNNLIPISIQVTLEFIRFFQAAYINSDIEMYDEATDTPANTRTSNLNEELGQVKFLMSDKTGTLTKNVMKFKRCTIAGMNYGDDTAEEFRDPSLLENLRNNHPTASQIYDFMLAVSVCHTVVPELDEESAAIKYQASSPDESALVNGAASQSFIFSKRTPESMTVYANGERVELQLLNVLEFNSDRKIMSIILRFPDNSIRLLCKGADNVVLGRLKSDHDRAAIHACQEHLQAYAENGYRTLCFATRTIPEDRYQEWNKKHQEATVSLDEREKRLDDVAELIEHDLELIGATAIEDKLQEYVPETIKSLMEADIRIWILTGDKRETAINIAQSSGLCNKATRMLVLDKLDLDEVMSELKEFNETALAYQVAGIEFALVVSGEALRVAMNGQSKHLFASLAWLCRAVICCRMTPMQKAEVVELVQSFGKHIVLAIGDGANDVAMIQAANIGVGITGEEGMRAAAASDYSIAKFHFLRRLLLVHGTWNFDRSVKVILYSFYKNIALCFVGLWYAFFNAFSGQTIFDGWTIAMFNVFFTAWPPVVLGLFDRPINARVILENPSLYAVFQETAFSDTRFALWIGASLWHSLLLFFLTYAFVGPDNISPSGRAGGWLLLGNSIYTYLITTVSLKAMLECQSWTSLMVASIFASVTGWFAVLIIYSKVWPLFPIGWNMAGMVEMLCTSTTFWLGLIFVPITTILLDFVIKSLATTFYPSARDVVLLKKKGFLRPNLGVFQSCRTRRTTSQSVRTARSTSYDSNSFRVLSR